MHVLGGEVGSSSVVDSDFAVKSSYRGSGPDNTEWLVHPTSTSLLAHKMGRV